MTPSPPPPTAPVLERTFETGAQGRCCLRVPRAAVTLAPGPEGRAEVTVTMSDDASEDVRAAAEALDVHFANGVLHVEQPRPARLDAATWRAWREHDAPGVTLHVRVPSSFGADVRAVGGAVEVRDLAGPVTIEAAGGPVHASGLADRLGVQARRCQTTIAAFDGAQCHAHVRGGSLTVDAAAGEAVEVESHAARLHLGDLDAALRLAMHGGSGRVAGLRGPLEAEVLGSRCHFSPVAGQRASLHAPGGDVHLALPDGQAATLRLSAHRLDLGMLEGRFAGERSARHADGTLGGDGPLVEAHAPGGTVRLARTN